jgi:AsmA family protein
MSAHVAHKNKGNARWRRNVADVMTGPNPPPRDRFAALRTWCAHTGNRARAATANAWTRLAQAPWTRIGLWAGGAFGVLVLALALFLTFADWNAFRGPLARIVSSATGRPISIDGNLNVHPWSWTPRLHVQGLRIGNQARFGDRGEFAEIGDADMHIKLLPLLVGRFDIVSLDLRRANVALYRTADGDANWANAPDAARAGKPFQLPAIHHFSVRDGQLFFRDDQRETTLRAAFTTEESAARGDGGRFLLTGDGQINRQPFTLVLTGDPLIHVRQDEPYAFVAQVRAGSTHIQANGQIIRPFDFGNFYAEVKGAGPDLSDLYHLTGLALPNTPPYQLRGRLERRGGVYGMHDIAGRVGHSDLRGAFTATHQRDGRLFLDGNFYTADLDLNDLLAVLGGEKGRGGRLSQIQHATGGAHLTPAAARIMPDAALDIRRVRNMDARVSYRASHVRSQAVSLRGFAIDVDLNRGLLKLDPMTLELAQGRLAGAVAINARENTPRVDADLRLSQARIENIVPMGAKPPLTGSLVGRARLTGRGASVREAAAHANGDVTFITPHGEVREALAELTGVNVTRGLGLLLSHNQDKIDVRCGVASFHVEDGVAHANTFVFDTSTMLIRGRGSVRLRDETLDLELHGQPKTPRLVRLAAPITIEGPWRRPRLGVQAGRAAGQGIAALLASLAAPIAAILPFVDAGLAKDADCGTLLAAGAAPRRVREG